MYYKIPLQLHLLIDGNEMPTCDLSRSISQNIELIITTKFGEHRSDPTFGCEIWDLDFELIISAGQWEEKLRHSLLKSLTTHEQRLSDTTVTISINDMEKFNVARQTTELKKRVNIHVAGTIKKTGEPFHFNTNMFLSPLSLE